MSSTDATTPPWPVAARGRRRSLAFATVLLAFVLEIADATIVNTALPAIQHGLGAGDAAAQWIVSGYFTTFAVLLVAGGRLGDLYGYRRMFLIGVGGFTIASLGCGLAPTSATLIAARICQGAAAAVMAPQVMALIQLLFSPLERVGKLAVFGLIGGLAAIGGPIVGGALIGADIAGLGWRPIFLLNLPVGVAACVAGRTLLPPGRSTRPLRLDPVGTGLLAATLLAVLVPAIEGRQLGWPWWCGALLIATAPLAILFWRHSVRRIERVGSALIAPELFAQPTFRIGLAMMLVFGTATNGFLLVLALMLQRGLGYSALDTAFLHVPFGLGVMLGVAAIGRRLLPSIGGLVVVAGAAVMATALAGVAVAAAGSADPALMAVLLAVAGVGMGCVTGPLGPIALARVDRGHAGVAGGMANGAQQIGGALGAATIGSIFLGLFDSRSPTTTFAFAIAATVFCLAAVAVLAWRLPTSIFAAER